MPFYFGDFCTWLEPSQESKDIFRPNEKKLSHRGYSR